MLSVGVNLRASGSRGFVFAGSGFVVKTFFDRSVAKNTLAGRNETQNESRRAYVVASGDAVARSAWRVPCRLMRRMETTAMRASTAAEVVNTAW